MSNPAVVIPAGEPNRALVSNVINELKSGYKPNPSVTGPACKEIQGISLVMTKFDANCGDILAVIDVKAYQYDPHGAGEETRRTFWLPRADVRCLANEAPSYAANFAAIADQMDEERSVLAGQDTTEPQEVSRIPVETAATSRALPRVRSIRFS